MKYINDTIDKHGGVAVLGVTLFACTLLFAIITVLYTA